MSTYLLLVITGWTICSNLFIALSQFESVSDWFRGKPAWIAGLGKGEVWDEIGVLVLTFLLFLWLGDGSWKLGIIFGMGAVCSFLALVLAWSS